MTPAPALARCLSGLALLLATAAAAELPFEIRHRGRGLRVDGDSSDWRSDDPTVRIVRPTDEDAEPARATVRLAWDRDTLYVLFEVADPTTSRAPEGVAGPALFQWDSVEVYVDARGDRARRMGSDDFQLIVAPDGRYAVLQGDPLLHQLEAMEVPKRERPSIAIRAAGRRTADGYVVECAVPFAALGVAPSPGLELALDLGLNDWTVEHPPLDQLEYDLDTLHKLEAAGAPVYDANGLAIGAAAALERASYRPWAWSGSGDFGHPSRWRPVRLVGAPPFAERVVSALGPARTLALGGLVTAGLLGATLAGSQRRHRRRVARLLERIAMLEDDGAAAAAQASAPALPEPERDPPDRLEWLERAADRESSAGDDRPLEIRAIRAIHERLAEPLRASDLAEALFVSLRTLERHLSEALACSPGELILAVKMRQARRLLEANELQVQAVARRVGFDDPAHFSRRFKAYFGLPPAAIRAAVAAARERSVA